MSERSVHTLRAVSNVPESAGIPGLTPMVHTNLDVAAGRALPLASRENWIVIRCAATFLPLGCLTETVILIVSTTTRTTFSNAAATAAADEMLVAIQHTCWRT
jgi:hypothetical protein